MTKIDNIYTNNFRFNVLLICSPLILISLYKFIKNKNYRKIMYIYFIPIVLYIFALGTQYGTGAIRQRIAVYPFIVFLCVFELCQVGTNQKYKI